MMVTAPALHFLGAQPRTHLRSVCRSRCLSSSHLRSSPSMKIEEKLWRAKERVNRLPEVKVARKREGSEGTYYYVDVLVPSEVKGVLVFVHGFAQYPDAYLDLLYGVADRNQVAILAPETGILAPYVWKQLLSNFWAYIRAYGLSGSLQYALQNALAQDSKELIDNICSDDKVIVDAINKNLSDGATCSPKSLPIALLGHSMGGGLLFWLAAAADVRTFCSLAPYPKLQGQYDPIAVIDDPERRNWGENILLVAGSLDFVARKGIFSKPGADIFNLVQSSANKTDSNSVYSQIALGLHSNFEDGVFVGETPLKSILRILNLLLTFLSFPLANVISIVNQLLILLQFAENRSEQIEISVALASYWIEQGMKGKKPSVEELQAAFMDSDDIEKKRKDRTIIKGPNPNPEYN